MSVIKKMMTNVFYQCLVLTALLAMLPTTVNSMRGLNSVTTPSNIGVSAQNAENQLGFKVPPLAQDVIQKKVIYFFEQWNTGNIEKNLASSFSNKQQLLDAMAQDLPANAKIDVKSMKTPQTIETIQVLSNGNAFNRVVTIDVEVETDIVYTDSTGRQTINGVNQYKFKFTETYNLK